MKVLVACEMTGEIRRRLRKIGINAISCDFFPALDGETKYHYQGDVRDILYEPWDAIVAFPPCDFLANSGSGWLYKKTKTGKRIKNKERWTSMYEAAEFFNLFLDSKIKLKLIENPIQHKHARKIIRKYDQIIHPWMFGHMEQKATCLWLEGFPKLVETNNVKKEMMKLSDKERQRLHYLPPSLSRKIERSKTFPGIAEAIVNQYFLGE